MSSWWRLESSVGGGVDLTCIRLYKRHWKFYSARNHDWSCDWHGILKKHIWNIISTFTARLIPVFLARRKASWMFMTWLSPFHTKPRSVLLKWKNNAMILGGRADDHLKETNPRSWNSKQCKVSNIWFDCLRSLKTNLTFIELLWGALITSHFPPAFWAWTNYILEDLSQDFLLFLGVISSLEIIQDGSWDISLPTRYGCFQK